jgi:predicted nucleic acid-binding protein
VIDASVAVKWYLRDEDLLSQADSLLSGYGDGSLDATAPNLSRYEVASALLVAHRSGRIGVDDVHTSLEDYSSLGIIEANDTDLLLVSAARLVADHGLGYYDGVYLALAEEIGGQFVTADDRFYKRAREHFPNVVWLGDVPE